MGEVEAENVMQQNAVNVSVLNPGGIERFHVRLGTKILTYTQFMYFQ